MKETQQQNAHTRETNAMQPVAQLGGEKRQRTKMTITEDDGNGNNTE